MNAAQVIQALQDRERVSHPSRPNVAYKLTGLRKVKIAGQWQDYVDYTDGVHDFSRHATDFEKFKLFFEGETFDLH